MTLDSDTLLTILPHAHRIPPLLVVVSAIGFNLINLPISSTVKYLPPNPFPAVDVVVAQVSGFVPYLYLESIVTVESLS